MKALIRVVIVLSLFSNFLQSQSEIFKFVSSDCGTFYANETTSNGENNFERYSCLTGNSLFTFLGKEKIFKIYLETPVNLHVSMNDSQFSPKFDKLFNRRRLLFYKIGTEINAYKKCQI